MVKDTPFLKMHTLPGISGIQSCEHTKNHPTVYFKMENFMVCELDLRKKNPHN